MTISREPIRPEPGEQIFHMWGRTMSTEGVYYVSAPTMAAAIEHLETATGITVNFASGLVPVDHGFDTLQDFLNGHRGMVPA